MANKEYKKFVVGETLRDIIQELESDQRLRFYEAIMDYGIDKKEPNFTGMEKALWVSIRDVIDNTRPKKGAQYGNKNASKETDDEEEETDENESEQKETNKTNGNESPNVNDNGNGNVNVNANDNVNSSGSSEPPGKKSSSKRKSKKPPLREREPVNDMERVEKAYRQNWNTLFAQGKVKTAEPVINWNQTRKQIKDHFERVKPDLIIQAINKGMTDNFVLGSGYSLGIMLSAKVLNRLINASAAAAPPGLADKNALSGLTSTF